MLLYLSRLSLCLSALTILFLYTASAVTAQELSAEEVIANAIDNRLKITSYDIEIKLDYGTDDAARIQAGRYYLEGDRLRVDLKYPYLTNRFSGLTETHFWDHTIYLPKKMIHFSSMLLRGPGKLGVKIDQDADRSREKYTEAKIWHDVRSLGFHTVGVTEGHDIEAFLRTASLPEKTVQKDTVNGIDCLKVSFKLKTGIKCDFWFAPSKGYSPIRARGYYKPHDFEYMINLNVEEWCNSGLWYPTSYSSFRRYGVFSKEIENGSIVVHSLNEPLDNSTFEITTLDVPIGRSVRTLPSNGPKRIWDGKKAVLQQRRQCNVKQKESTSAKN